MRNALVILLLVALAAPAPAAVYRCRDKRGVLILTDDPDNFPPGCRPEGKQGETAVPPGGQGASPGAGRAGREPAGTPPPPASQERRTFEGSAPPGGPQQPPAGSAGIPPGLNRPGRPAPPPAEEPEEKTPAAPPPRPGAAAQENSREAAPSPELERWLEEARALNREYLEAQTGPPSPPGAPDRLREIESRIDAFVGRLDASPLSPKERTVVEGELPPPRR